MSRSRWLRGLVATVLMAAGVATTWGQQVMTPPPQQKINLDIPSQPVAGALTALGQQSGLTIMLAAAAKADAVSPAVVGDYTPDEALRRILAPTGLKAEYLDAKTIKVRTADAESEPVGGVRSHDTKPAELKEAGEKENNSSSATSAEGKNSTTDPRSSAAPLEGRGMAEILIRGSRTMNVDVVRSEDDAVPYTILTSEQIANSGATDIEDFLKQYLTMNTTAQSQSEGVPLGHGTISTINLRGLGANETLILIDGRRSAGVSITGNTLQSDINGIPLSAVERIEVLPSSASAIYGGAAVGGVVNIVLKRQFEGGGLSYTYDRAENSDAVRRTVNGSYGLSFNGGRTQVMVGGQYTDGNPLRFEDRPNLVLGGIQTILANSPSFFSGTATPFAGATTNIASASIGSLTLRNGTSLNSGTTYIPAGTAPGATISSGLLANAGTYNYNLARGTGTYGLLNNFGTVPTTKSLLATVRQTVFDDVQVFSELSTNTNSGDTIRNPFSGTYRVPSVAPTNPFRQNVNITFPSNISPDMKSNSVTQSATVGLIAPLWRAWSSELDYTWSRNSFRSTSFSADSAAFNAALRTGAVNPFVDTIAYPLNLNQYLAPQLYSGSATLNDLTLRISGRVVRLPAGDATLTLGVEHRKEGSHNAHNTTTYPITTASSTDVLYFGQSQSTNSLYSEVNIPLVEQANNVPAIYSLALQLAGRTEKYKVFAGTPFKTVSPVAFQAFDPPQGVRTTIEYTSTNPTLGIKYSPIKDVILRGSYSRAFLPPTAGQFLADPTPLFGGPFCATITDPRNSQTYGIDCSQGGNPGLKPQTSRDWDFGAIWEPQEDVLRGMRLDVEYYRIVQPNYIAIPTAQEVVSDPSYAERVTRDPVTGRITIVNTSYVNAERYETGGWDIKFDYRKATKIGVFELYALATVIRYDDRQYTLGSPMLDYVGYPSEGGEGKVKANAALTWQHRSWTLGWAASYFSNYRQYNSPGSPLYIQFGPNARLTSAQGGETIPSQAYHSVFLSYGTGGGNNSRSWRNELLSNWTAQIGIKNVFNTRPPFDANYVPYSYSPYGDPRMREYWVSAKKDF